MELRAHQKVSLEFLSKNSIAFDASDPGTGKTAVQLFDIAAKKRAGGKAALVIAPKSILEAAWLNDTRKFTPHLRAVVAHAKNRAEAFECQADIYITNVDAVNWLATRPAKFFEKFDILILDEITKFKHRTTSRAKSINKIKKFFPIRRGMSGTPNSRSITDVWHQYYILDDGKRLGSSYYAFQAATCEARAAGPAGCRVEWVDKEGAEAAIAGLVNDITVRHKFEDCIDIPPNEVSLVPYKLSPKQAAIYKEMRDSSVAMLREDQAITALNAAAVAGKLLQIASGAVYSSEDHTAHIVDTGRYELVMDLVEQRKHSIVMFLWGHQRDLFVKESIARGVSYAVIDGSTKDTRRSEIVDEFQAGKYQVLFCHPETCAHGLTLTKATSTIWPTPTYNLDWFVQGNRRIYRSGQTERTETIVILGENTLDAAVYKTCEDKHYRLTNLLEML